MISNLLTAGYQYPDGHSVDFYGVEVVQFYVQRFGADGFVKKPFGRSDVFHAIRSLVQAGRMPGRRLVTPWVTCP